MDNFYCQQKCVEIDFSINEWNKNYLEIEAMPITRDEKDKLIHGEPCIKQCFECMCVVGKARIKNKNL